jgi:hypothetical protein
MEATLVSKRTVAILAIFREEIERVVVRLAVLMAIFVAIFALGRLDFSNIATLPMWGQEFEEVASQNSKNNAQTTDWQSSASLK